MLFVTQMESVVSLSTFTLHERTDLGVTVLTTVTPKSYPASLLVSDMFLFLMQEMIKV